MKRFIEGAFLFPSRLRDSAHLSTRPYARIVESWVSSIGLDSVAYGTHSMRRTKATLIGGGGAVSQYSDNEYMTTDLDFITVERNKVIAPIVAELGFTLQGKDFHHPKCRYFLEFPPGPISFGDRYVDSSETTFINTPFGKLRIITPTQCVLDRLAWFIHGGDRQARDQAIMVARRQEIDWDDVHAWARNEDVDASVIAELREEIDAE